MVLKYERQAIISWHQQQKKDKLIVQLILVTKQCVVNRRKEKPFISNTISMNMHDDSSRSTTIKPSSTPINAMGGRRE